MAERPIAAGELGWGRHYLAVRPDQFRVDYVINPFMDVDDQPDPVVAREQWDHLVATLEQHGARVDVLEQRSDAPDMVYAMNLGLAVTRTDGAPEVLLSHMRYEQRRMESDSALAWFADRDHAVRRTGHGGIGAHFEAGDAFPYGGELVVGFGPRTEEDALKHLATELGVRVRGLRIDHPGMYHLDLAFCPLDERRALVCPDALTEESAATLLALVPEPLVLTESEALETFAANSVVIGRTVVMPACPPRVREQLEAWGFEVVLVELGEFHKGGGSVRCLTNPLDIALGRDLDPVPGGEVLLP